MFSRAQTTSPTFGDDAEAIAYLERWCKAHQGPDPGYRAELVEGAAGEWEVVVDLRDSPLAHLCLQPTGWDRGSDDRHCCWADDGLYHGVGAEANLRDIISTFRWAVEGGAERKPPLEPLAATSWATRVLEAAVASLGFNAALFATTTSWRLAGALVAVGFTAVWSLRERQYRMAATAGLPVRGNWFQRRQRVLGGLPERPARLAFDGADLLGAALGVLVASAFGLGPTWRVGEWAVNGVLGAWFTLLGLRVWRSYRAAEARKAHQARHSS